MEQWEIVMYLKFFLSISLIIVSIVFGEKHNFSYILALLGVVLLFITSIEYGQALE
jgi:hypothetical protein